MDYFLVYNNKIINRIVWNGDEYKPGPGHSLIPCSEYPAADIGWLFDGVVFYNPKTPAENFEPEEIILLE